MEPKVLYLEPGVTAIAIIAEGLSINVTNVDGKLRIWSQSPLATAAPKEEVLSRGYSLDVVSLAGFEGMNQG